MTSVPTDRPSRAPQERSTRQKRALAAILESSDGFRSAQDLFTELRARGENVGLTTVYNQLRALAEAGDIDVQDIILLDTGRGGGTIGSDGFDDQAKAGRQFQLLSQRGRNRADGRPGRAFLQVQLITIEGINLFLQAERKIGQARSAS